MPFGVRSRFFLLFLFSFSLFNFACGQPEKQQPTEFNKHEAKAFELRQKGDLRGAIQEQTKAIELNPSYAQSLTVLAGMYVDLYEQNKSKENLEKAKELLTKALELDPNDAVGHDMLAGTLDRLGDKSGALRESEKVVRLLPNDLEGLTNLAINQNDNEQTNDATATLEKVLQKNPNYAYALYHYAELELEKNNRTKAIELFERGSKATASDNKNDTKYIEICRKRLQELNNQKTKTAKAPN